jgi:hypothetical protein
MAYQQNSKSENRSVGTPYNQAYSPLNFNTSLNIDEIDVFRKRLIANMSDLNLNKHRLRAGEFDTLSNYHNYALNVLNNMQNIKKVEDQNPYNRNMQSVMGGQAQPGIENLAGYGNNLKVIYNPDGRTQIISTDDYSKKYKQEWEKSFDEGLINPPSFMIPPSNCWNLPKKN